MKITINEHASRKEAPITIHFDGGDKLITVLDALDLACRLFGAIDQLCPGFLDIPEQNKIRSEMCIRACTGLPDSLLEEPSYFIKAELESLDGEIMRRIRAENQLKEILSQNTQEFDEEMVYVDFKAIREALNG